MLSIYIDGASRGNPGDAGIGIIIKGDDGTPLYSAAGYSGKMTNNAAEYTALITALTKLKKTPSLLTPSPEGIPSGDPLRIKRKINNHQSKKPPSPEVVIYSDSELIVRQINKIYKVKEPELKKLYDKVVKLLESLPYPVQIKHIRREQNREADRLANIGIESKIRIAL